MKVRSSLVSIFLLMTSFNVLAVNVYSKQFQTIQEIEFYELVMDENGDEKEILLHRRKVPDFFEALAKEQQVQKMGLGNILMVTKQLVALGKSLYKIVEGGKPVVTVNSEAIQVLPRDSNGATIGALELAQWKIPVVRKYRVVTKNYLGMAPVSFDFMLIFTYGGSHKGKGKYITGAQIKPTAINVSWGYKFDAEFKVQTIMNQGTTKDPIAGAVLMLDYKVSSVLQSRGDNQTFFINGIGEVTSY